MTNVRGTRTRRSASEGAPDRVTKALVFAVEAHRGQTRKDRRTPYIVHPVAVMRVLSSELGLKDPDLLCAALLHDVLEDTLRTATDLKRRFGARVTRWVEELTIPKEFHGPTVSDSIKTELLVEAVSHMSWEAIMVKLADRTDNLRDSANAYWNSPKRRGYRTQSKAILRAVERRSDLDRADRVIRGSLPRAQRLLKKELLDTSA
jgi:GTP diphosphokinase / guanosine-3',5'-bis(diphosphate) 3'-diphosphatase